MAKGSKAGRPIVACEITGAHAFVARAAENGPGIEILQTRTFPEGLTPNLVNANIPDREAVRIVLADAFLHVGSHSKEVTLVVPDAAVRVVLLDFDTLPDRKAEADAVVRFRLKKALPFDVDRATISYHAQPNGTTLKVIVAVIMNSVLAEYESVVRDTGYMPGVVLPSTLAAIGNIRGDDPTMVVKVVEGSTTIAILNQGRLLFYRTLDHGASTEEVERLAEDIYPSTVFFQDLYGIPIERIYLAGFDLRANMAERLSKETRAAVEELVNPEFAGLNPGHMPKSMLAGVLGALTS
jgi:type IV pilus assembly protein PilM